MRIVYSAKNWQDNLQSVLPGYRERIVHVVLKSDEGGINLTMPDTKVKKLSDYGPTAGNDRADNSIWTSIAGAGSRRNGADGGDLGDVAQACDQGPAASRFMPAKYGIGNLSRRRQSAGANPETDYLQDTRARVDAMMDRAAELVALGRRWSADPIMRGMGADIPKPATDLRITPKY